jgi:nucleoside phosphorylase
VSDAQAITKRPATAVILTALQLEIKAVTAHLQNIYEVEDGAHNIYDCGDFIANGRRWSVAVLECGPGNQRAAIAAAFAKTQFDPDVLIFVGVAGGVKNLRLGDVVASTKVYGYQSGKSKQGFQPRPEIALSDHGLEQRAKATARRDGWLNRLSVRPPPDCVPSATVGPIAAGDEVVADDSGETYLRISQMYGDALAIDMESYGALSAVRQLGIPGIVVRGISDTIANKSESDAGGWQPVAARHASAFLFEMLANYEPPARIPGSAPRSLPPKLPTGSEKEPCAGIDPEEMSPGATERVQRSGTNDDLLDIDGQRVLFQRASETLLAWPTCLDGDKWIQRPELRDIETQLASDEPATLLVLGDAGSGKSALLARLGKRLIECNVATLAIKADALSEKIQTQVQLAEQVGFDALIQDVVRAAAFREKVVVIVDQLDAVADLVDLKSERLNLLLNLIRDVSNVPNVQVVCSCRSFEFRHDARLLSIDAEMIELSLPSWDQVAEILTGSGVNAVSWPEAFRELLRSPQHLKVFMAGLTDGGEPRIFENYRRMLDDLWKRRVTNRPGPLGRAALLAEIAADMAQNETLWLPASRFEDRSELVDNLEAAGILVRPGDGPRIGFQHQTLFEHARARAFAKGGVSLAEFVRARQDALFVRPTLWTSLGYLREADPVTYERELGLLDDAELRLHVRYLLIEFLGQAQDPSLDEIRRFGALLGSAKWRSKALHSIRGSRAWFNTLINSHFPSIMQLPDGEAWPMVGVLSGALGFARGESLDLVERHWLRHQEKDFLTWQALEGLKDWDETRVGWICQIIRRNEVQTFRVMIIAEKLLACAPTLAPRVVGAALEAGLLRSLSDATANAADDADVVREQTCSRYQAFLEQRQSWYDLPKIAKAAPEAFLDSFWPVFLSVVDKTVRPSNDPRRARFRDSYASVFRLKDDPPSDYPIMEAVDCAIRCLARSDPAAFWAIVERDGIFDAVIVQRLFARGMLELGPQHASRCLTFLLQDKRRLMVGSWANEQADSVALIEKFAPQWNDHDIELFEQATLTWSLYRPDAEIDEHEQVSNRGARLRILAAVPEAKLSPTGREFIVQAKLQFPSYQEPDFSSGRGGVIGSPMSAEQMQGAMDDEIIELFRQLPDSTGDRHPEDHLLGGSDQASHEFEKFAAQNPDRAARIISEFLPGEQENPAGHGIEGLSRSAHSDEDLFQLIDHLHARGLRSEGFRVRAAQAIGSRSKDGLGLPENMIAILEEWLAVTWTFRPEPDAFARSDQQPSPRPLFWGGGGFRSVPFGSYSVLRALTYGYLLRTPAETERWLGSLEQHLKRREQSATWQAIADDLKWLRNCKDKSRAARFLLNLFQRFPRALASIEGGLLLTSLWHIIEPQETSLLLHEVRDSCWPDGPQAFGELLCVRALWFPEEEATTRELDALLEPCELTEELTLIRTGIGFAASRLWEEPPYKERATEILVRLMPQANESVTSAIMDVFVAADEMGADMHTRKLLTELLVNRDLLESASSEFLVERLLDLLPFEVDLVYALSHLLVRTRGKELQTLRTTLATSAPHLVNIALTIQRIGGEYRAKGLDLFEDLLVLDVYDAQAAINELDLRPINGYERSVFRRPRRRRKAN